jgi:hypothetical protein
MDGGKKSRAIVWRRLSGVRPPRKNSLKKREVDAAALVAISFRTSTDIRAVQNVLPPFIDLHDDGAYQDYESEKNNCLDDHFLILQSADHILIDEVRRSTKSSF